MYIHFTFELISFQLNFGQGICLDGTCCVGYTSHFNPLCFTPAAMDPLCGHIIPSWLPLTESHVDPIWFHENQLAVSNKTKWLFNFIIFSTYQKKFLLNFMNISWQLQIKWTGFLVKKGVIFCMVLVSALLVEN